MNNNLIEKIIDYIKNMKFGESNSIINIVNIVSTQKYNVDELFDIQETVLKRCEEQCILCDYSKWKETIVGLPFNIQFVKKEKPNNSFSETNCFYKKNSNDTIWWINNKNEKGKNEFSFDQIKVYNLFKDYPYELTQEEVKIFDSENPYWADFFKDRKKILQDNNIDVSKWDIDYEKRKFEEELNADEKIRNEYKIKLEKIKNMFFENYEDYFESIKMYLPETFDYDLLCNPIYDCVRFELYDKENNKKLFFAINKNMFLLHDQSKHKLSLRGNNSEERLVSLINDLNNITCSWSLDYKDVGEYFWGLTICYNNNCSLYAGKTSSIDNWKEFTIVINSCLENLINNTITDTFL